MQHPQVGLLTHGFAIAQLGDDELAELIGIDARPGRGQTLEELRDLFPLGRQFLQLEVNAVELIADVHPFPLQRQRVPFLECAQRRLSFLEGSLRRVFFRLEILTPAIHIPVFQAQRLLAVDLGDAVQPQRQRFIVRAGHG